METNNNNTGNSVVTNPQALAMPAAVTPPPTVPPAGKARVAMSFINRDTDAALLVASLRIIASMTGNPAYPAPYPKLADLTAARNAYIAVMTASRDSRIALVVRKQQRAAFEGMLRNLALYVQLASNGDLATLLGSGFTAQRVRQPVGMLPAPANVRLSRGKASGQLVARCNRVPQAGAYAWRYASAAAPTTWTNVVTTFAASVLIEGLTPGTQYSVQSRALAKDGPSDWSSAASLMVV